MSQPNCCASFNCCWEEDFSSVCLFSSLFSNQEHGTLSRSCHNINHRSLKTEIQSVHSLVQEDTCAAFWSYSSWEYLRYCFHENGSTGQKIWRRYASSHRLTGQRQKGQIPSLYNNKNKKEGPKKRRDKHGWRTVTDQKSDRTIYKTANNKMCPLRPRNGRQISWTSFIILTLMSSGSFLRAVAQ